MKVVISALLVFGFTAVSMGFILGQPRAYAASVFDSKLKATHNSYACTGLGDNTCPVMHHHPERQVDDWGVWGVELDFGIIGEPARERAYVGHSGTCGHGCWTFEGWGPYLDDYF